MGRMIAGIHGHIQGTVGKLIGSSRNGIPYVKGPYKKRTKKVSDLELLNRKKFAEAQEWLAPLVDFVREGFRNFSQRSQGFVAAKSWLLKNAFVGEGESMRINSALVKLSSGDLHNPENMAVALTETGDLKFTWKPAKPGSGDDRDQIMMLAYDAEQKKALYITNGQFRGSGADILPVSGYKGYHFHVYAAFVAADRSRQSDSIYLGEVKI